MRVTSLVLAFLLLFCGCGTTGENVPGKTPLAEHSGNYRTTAHINYKDLKASASISQETPSSCSVVFESPPSLKEMAFVFRQDSVDLSYKGLSFSFNPDSMPGGAVAKLAVSAINKAMKDEGLNVALDGSALEVTGMLENGEFSLKLDGKTGNLLKLSVPAEELEIEFVNFQFFD